MEVFYQLNRLTAVLGYFFFFLQFILSSRVKLIESRFGLDKMIHHHRTFGRLALGLLLLHPVFLLVYEFPLGLFYINIYRLIGVTALSGLFVTAFFAVFYQKLNIAYEVWLNMHKANYLLFPLASVHVAANAKQGTLLSVAYGFFGFAFLAMVVYKIWRFFAVRRHPYEVLEVRPEAGDIWSIYLKGRHFPYMPGQFMFLQLKRNGKISEPHPFTISSSPTWPYITVTAKELGDFTKTVKDTKAGDRAFIDAPYGLFSFLPYDCQCLVLIAGGIGITPFMSMLRYMYDQRIEIPVTLLWGNKNEDGLPFRDELAMMEREMPHWKIIYVMSSQEGWQGEKGRIDRQMIAKYELHLPECRFFICGPPPMSKAAKAALLELGVPRTKIHDERFAL